MQHSLLNTTKLLSLTLKYILLFSWNEADFRDFSYHEHVCSQIAKKPLPSKGKGYLLHAMKSYLGSTDIVPLLSSLGITCW
jgi:hypothetical protein